jgi:hypothetical protein
VHNATISFGGAAALGVVYNCNGNQGRCTADMITVTMGDYQEIDIDKWILTEKFF